MPRVHDAFISYAREDIAAATRLASDLRGAGYSVWLDDDNLLPGQNWKHEIENAIAGARAFIFLLSNHSATKAGYVQKEVRLAIEMLDRLPEGAVFVIPARLEDVKSTHRRFDDLHQVDLFSSWNIGVQKIQMAMSANRASSTATSEKNDTIQPGVIGAYIHAVVNVDADLKALVDQLKQVPKVVSVVTTFGDVDVVIGVETHPSGKLAQTISGIGSIPGIRHIKTLVAVRQGL